MKYLLLLVLWLPVDIGAQEYPFVLPEIISATLSVNTGVTEKVNNNNLGVNIDWHNHKKMGYNHPEAKSFVRQYKPVSIRWPQGLWANFYDWKVDGRRRYDDYVFNNEQYIKAIEDHPDLVYGFPGFHELHSELKFDVLWVFNMLYDSEASSLERMLDRQAKGFKVDAIEMGNEQFWKSQRSNQVSTPEKYFAFAKSLSATLKKANPTVKVSIPLSWRTGGQHDEFNIGVTKETSYFDAISVHMYVRSERDPVTVSQEQYKTVLTARLTLDESVKHALSFAPGKEVWLSEWGVSVGMRAASYLGMADAYLYILENQNMYTRTNWFHINNSNPFFQPVQAGKPELGVIKYGFGAVYDVIREVFQDAVLLKSDMSTHKLKPGADAVSARAVIKNGETMVFAVNKTSKSVELKLKVDGSDFSGYVNHEALIFQSLSDNPEFGGFDNPLKPVKSGTGIITLPPYSVNKIGNIGGSAPTTLVSTPRRGGGPTYFVNGGNRFSWHSGLATERGYFFNTQGKTVPLRAASEENEFQRLPAHGVLFTGFGTQSGGE